MKIEMLIEMGFNEPQALHLHNLEKRVKALEAESVFAEDPAIAPPPEGPGGGSGPSGD